MCNAWNHAPGCTCGWGGDTGGGGWRDQPPSPVRYLSVADGKLWQRGQDLTFESFCNPNARCPVCGASVFFVQTMYGGRVFFDDLGPPWPKHPCTDNYFRTTRVPMVLSPSQSIRSVMAWRSKGWEPLIDVNVTLLARGVVVTAIGASDGVTYRLGLPAGIAPECDGPMFCRPSRDGSGRYELAFIRETADKHEIRPQTRICYPDAVTDEQIDRWQR